MNRTRQILTAVILCAVVASIGPAIQHAEFARTAYAVPALVAATVVDTGFDADSLGSLPGPFVAETVWPSCSTQSVVEVSDDASLSGLQSLKVQHGCTNTPATATGWSVPISQYPSIKRVHLTVHRKMLSHLNHGYLGMSTGGAANLDGGMLEFAGSGHLFYIPSVPQPTSPVNGTYHWEQFKKVDLIWVYDGAGGWLEVYLDDVLEDIFYQIPAPSQVTGYARHEGSSFFDDNVRLVVEYEQPDTDEDGIGDSFESGFGGTVPEDSLAVTNPETGDAATASGSAEDGATISSGSFTIELPPNTVVDNAASQIEISLVPGAVARVEVAGADLGGGTKSITMPFDGDAENPAVCIDDSPTASIDSIVVGGSCGATLVAIPAGVGQSTTAGTFTVTRLSDSPPRVTVDGLHYTALATLDAPLVVNTVSANLAPVPVDSLVNAAATFADTGDGDAHTAVWQWGDATTSSATVDQDGNTLSGSHSYSEPGVYTISVTVTNPLAAAPSNTASGKYSYVVVYDPDGGYVTGGGWIASPARAYRPDPDLSGKATFGFVAKYRQGKTLPEGNTEFQFKAGSLNFKSTGDYMWLVVSGSGHKATYKGSGKINGAGSYGVSVTAIDAANTPSSNVDLFRIKIWDQSNDDAVVYDNQLGTDCPTGDDADPCTAIGGGSIVIHKN